MEAPIFINSVNRMVKAKGALSSLLVTGSDKVENGFGNGDCLLIDFSRFLFALSDGSERHPNASRILLEELAGWLPAKLSFDIGSLQAAVGKIYKEQKYTHKCTFSCAAVVKNKGELTACISSGGDSTVMVADSSDGSILFKTASDMNFAGRSKTAPGISIFGLKNRGLRIILATDGFIEALSRISKPESGRLPGWLFEDSVCGIAEKFLRRLKAKRLPSYDDIGMIILNPFALKRDDCTILTGGTLPSKEVFFVSSLEPQKGRWLAKESWRENAGLFDAAGITIKDKNK
jgi:hypothetical protein